MGNTVDRVNAANTTAIPAQEVETPKAKKTKIEIGAALVHQDGLKPGITAGIEQTLFEKNGSKLSFGAETGAYLKMGRVGADLTYTKELNPNLKLGGGLEGSYEFRGKQTETVTYMQTNGEATDSFMMQKVSGNKGYALGKAFVEYSPSSKWDLKAGVKAGEAFNGSTRTTTITMYSADSTDTKAYTKPVNGFKAGAFAEASYNINDNLKLGAYGDSLKKEAGVSVKFTF